MIAYSKTLSTYIISFFSTKGRIRRRTYISRGFLLMPTTVLIGLISDHVVINIFVLTGIILFIIQTIKRLHDINHSGWVTLIMLIPIINILMGAYVLLRRGNKGSNQYGLSSIGI